MDVDGDEAAMNQQNVQRLNYRQRSISLEEEVEDEDNLAVRERAESMMQPQGRDN